MLIGLGIMGLLLIASALKGTEHELGQQLQNDLLGANGFIVWIFAIIALGALGYVPGLERSSNYLLILLLVVVLLRNGGVWANLQGAIQQASGAGPAPSVAPPPQSSGGSSGGQQQSGSGGSDGSSEAISAITTIAEIAAFA